MSRVYNLTYVAWSKGHKNWRDRMFELFAVTAFGIESVTARELKRLGYETKTEDGRVNFKGNFSDIARTNLWLRTANRVMLKMGEFVATDFDTLFDAVYSIEWQDLLPADADFPVKVSSVKSKLSSVPTCQSIIKKAIVEKLKTRYHVERFLEIGAKYHVFVRILKDTVTVSIDTTGESLNRRGYRIEVGQAPIKETLAAAMVILSRWKPEYPLWDGFCGTGTILGEAAMIAKNMAPGINRNFSFEPWKHFPKETIERERKRAKNSVIDLPLEISGTDIDGNVVESAVKNLKRAGLGGTVDLKAGDFKRLSPPGRDGFMISNLPYGKRTEEFDLEGIYGSFRDKLTERKDWSFFALTDDPDFEKKVGRATGNRKFFNGRIEVRLYRYERHGKRNGSKG